MCKKEVFYQYKSLMVKERTAKALKLDKSKMKKVIRTRETFVPTYGMGGISTKQIRDRKTRHDLIDLGIIW